MRAKEHASPNPSALRYKVAYAAIVSASIVWCALFVSVPFLAEGDPLTRKMASVITLFFAPICHQTPGRSFHLLGHPLAVCARCTGIYLGFLLGVAMFPFLKMWQRTTPPPRWIFGVALLPPGTEYILAKGGIIAPDSLLRGFASAPLGVIGAFCVLVTLFELIHTRQKP